MLNYKKRYINDLRNGWGEGATQKQIRVLIACESETVTRGSESKIVDVI